MMIGRDEPVHGLALHLVGWLALAVIATFLIPAVVCAQEMGETIVKNGKIETNLLLGGRTITLDAEINGDVTAMGQDIAIRGVVAGDVNVTAAAVEAEGHIRGDLRAFAGKVTITGRVDGDVNAATGSTRLAKEGDIFGDASLVGHEIFVAGHIQGNLKAKARRVTIEGTVDGDVIAEAERIRLGPTAVIKGKFTYHSEEDAEIDPKATIGDVTFMHSEEPSHSMKRVFAVAGGAGVVFFVGILLLAAVMIFIAPEISLRAAGAIRANPLRSGAIGLAVFVGAPIVVSLLFGTVVGFPIAIAMIIAYAVLVAAGYLIFALAVGRFAVGLAGKSWDDSTGGRIAAAEIGLVVLIFIALIPVVGVIVSFLAVIFGTGTLVNYLYRMRRSAPAA
jgi:cytoskeletal protein CcmA (bactofilin family)